jgi:hypothetical protein
LIIALFENINDAGSQAQGNNKWKFVRVQAGSFVCYISRFKQKNKRKFVRVQAGNVVCNVGRLKQK